MCFDIFADHMNFTYAFNFPLERNQRSQKVYAAYFESLYALEAPTLLLHVWLLKVKIYGSKLCKLKSDNNVFVCVCGVGCVWGDCICFHIQTWTSIPCLCSKKNGRRAVAKGLIQGIFTYGEGTSMVGVIPS